MKRPIDRETNTPIEPAHKFEVTLEPDRFTEEKFVNRTDAVRPLLIRNRFLLFENYQRTVHRESSASITRPCFKRFLCSGFRQKTFTLTGQKRNIGSYHQCYRLDGRLVALGVLDLLPDVVSSVYLV